MKTMRTVISCIGVFLLFPTLSAHAVFVGYDPLTNELPDVSWTLSNSTSPIASVSGGVANITTTSATGQYGRSTGFDAATGFTVDIRVKELADDNGKAGVGFRIIADDADDDGYAFIFKFHGRADGDDNKGVVSLAWSDGPNETSSVYMENDDWHVFRLAAQGENLKIYIDDQVTPIYDGTVTLADRGSGVISFGDWGNSVIGNAQLDYIRWDDTQAIFSAPVVSIPEPAMGLMFLAVAGPSLMARRKRLKQ